MRVVTSVFAVGRGWTPALPSELDGSSTLVLAFASPRYFSETAPLDELRGAFPLATVIGCSTAGEILDRGVLDDSIVVSIVRFERTTLATASVMNVHPSESHRTGEQLANSLRRDDLRAVFVLSQGSTVNGTELIAGLREPLGTDVVITGGLAGDGPRFATTWVMSGATISSQVVTAVGLYGDALRVGHGSVGGWDVFGPERLVTRSEANVLHELDGMPALSIYKKYLGDRAADLPGSALLFPLAVRPNRESEPVVRTILSIDEATQTMTFAGTVEQGWLAALMRANFERLILGAYDASRAAIGEERIAGDALSIAISCVGRRMVLGSRSEEETEAAFELLPDSAKQVGFYSYGEISPHATGRCELHNQTMTITLWWESQ